MVKWFRFPCGCTLYMDNKTGEVFRHVNKTNKNCMKTDVQCYIHTAYKMESLLEHKRGFALNDGSGMNAIRKRILDYATEDTIENLKEIMNVDSDGI